MAHARNNIGSVGVSTCLFAVPVPVSPDGKSEFLKVIVVCNVCFFNCVILTYLPTFKYY